MAELQYPVALIAIGTAFTGLIGTLLALSVYSRAKITGRSQKKYVPKRAITTFLILELGLVFMVSIFPIISADAMLLGGFSSWDLLFKSLLWSGAELCCLLSIISLTYLGQLKYIASVEKHSLRKDPSVSKFGSELLAQSGRNALAFARTEMLEKIRKRQNFLNTLLWILGSIIAVAEVFMAGWLFGAISGVYFLVLAFVSRFFFIPQLRKIPRSRSRIQLSKSMDKSKGLTSASLSPIDWSWLPGGARGEEMNRPRYGTPSRNRDGEETQSKRVATPTMRFGTPSRPNSNQPGALGPALTSMIASAVVSSGIRPGTPQRAGVVGVPGMPIAPLPRANRLPPLKSPISESPRELPRVKFQVDTPHDPVPRQLLPSSKSHGELVPTSQSPGDSPHTNGQQRAPVPSQSEDYSAGPFIPKSMMRVGDAVPATKRGLGELLGASNFMSMPSLVQKPLPQRASLPPLRREMTTLASKRSPPTSPGTSPPARPSLARAPSLKVIHSGVYRGKYAKPGLVGSREKSVDGNFNRVNKEGPISPPATKHLLRSPTSPQFSLVGTEYKAMMPTAPRRK